ncbi:anion permease [Micrococcales bacterium 31B]|nr:anion permease [Micrococcales bacterium 31B]
MATLALIAIVAAVWHLPSGGVSPAAGQLGESGRTTLIVFALSVWAWIFTKIDDTYVALAAGVALALLGIVGSDTLFGTLGDDTVWLLVAAFVIAAGVTDSGLAVRAAAWLITAARSIRSLTHLCTAALVITAFAVPSTSGRAALTLPVFLALAQVLSHEKWGGRHRRSVLVLALVFPTVILLSAVASLLGAGAHLVTSRVLETATGEGIDFVRWMILGLPLAVVSSHLAAELVLRMFSTRADRREPISVTIDDLQEGTTLRITGPLSVREGRAALILATVVALWCAEPLHGVDPALVALIGALITTSPRYGSTSLKKTLKSVPWSLLLFMAATLALGDALITSGAAEWVAGKAFGALGSTGPLVFVLAVIVVSTLAHLVIQSRSARSSVLVPIVVALAPAAGISPVAAAFASTAAAGFCHTLPSSAKPVALFSDIDGVETYRPEHLRRLSIALAPLMIALVLGFSYVVWPLLGMPL